jgi:hypothetical protein
MSVDYAKTVERHNKHVEHILDSKGYASTPEGRALVNQCLDQLTDFIASKRKQRPSSHKRAIRSLRPDVWRAIRGVPDGVMARAILIGLFNGIWGYRPERGEAREAKVTIGREIERQCRGVAIRRGNPQAAREITVAAAKRGSTRARDRVERQVLNQHADMHAAAGLKPIKVKPWNVERRLLVGNWGWDCVLQALPDVFCEGPNGLPSIRESAVDQGAEIAHALMMQHPVFVPSLEEPTPWTDFEDENGTPFVRNARDEKTIRQAMASGQMQPHVNAVNALQRVGWTINTDVLDLLQKLRSTPEGCALLRKVKHASGFAAFDALDMPMAQSLIGKKFWLKYNIDWRGRCYALPFFSYQRADHIRALFRLARGERIGSWGLVWLKATVAKHFGERTSLHERVAWTDERLDRIRRFAADPMAHLQWLQKASLTLSSSQTFITLVAPSSTLISLPCMTASQCWHRTPKRCTT